MDCLLALQLRSNFIRFALAIKYKTHLDGNKNMKQDMKYSSTLKWFLRFHKKYIYINNSYVIKLFANFRCLKLVILNGISYSAYGPFFGINPWPYIWKLENLKISFTASLKIFQVRSLFGPYFPLFGHFLRGERL